MRKTIERRITRMERTIEKAKDYIEKGVNIEGTHFLHLDDWGGESGHPKWMQNKMIPTLQKSIKKQEKLIDTLEDKAKDRKITERRNERKS